jgi:hypothetical protein
MPSLKSLNVLGILIRAAEQGKITDLLCAMRSAFVHVGRVVAAASDR